MQNRVTDVINKLMVSRGGHGGRINWEIRIDIYILLYVKYITNKDIVLHRELYSVFCMTYMGKES